MNYNIDAAIVIGFLILNLGVGLYTGRGVRTIQDYAIGDRNFSTAAIVATIVATCINGNFLVFTISEVYKEGIWFFIVALGDPITLILIGTVIVPKMSKFLGDLSVAETMGKVYGQYIRMITSVASLAQSVGKTALQVKVLSIFVGYFFSGLIFEINIENNLFISASDFAVIAASFIVILYSAFGGIKAVTFTDQLQMLTFTVLIPLFAIFVWQIFGDYELITYTLKNSDKFDFNQVINVHNPKFFTYLFLLIYFCVPSLDPSLYQRILISKDVFQVRKAFVIAGIIFAILHVVTCFIGLVAFTHNSNLDPTNIVGYVVDQFSFTGLRGLILVGILSMIMSTVDSWVNTGSVIFTNDLCASIGIKFKNNLLISRIFAILMGLMSIELTMSERNFMELFMLQANFYMPIVTVPLMLAIFNYRCSSKAVIIGMLSSIITIIIWRYQIQAVIQIDSVIPGTLVNLCLTLLVNRFVDVSPKALRINESEKMDIVVDFKYDNILVNKTSNIEKLNILQYCNNLLPHNSVIYAFFSLSIFVTLIVTLSIQKEIYFSNLYLINLVQGVILLIASFYLYLSFRSENISNKYSGVVWCFSIFISLILISSFLCLLSKFSHVSLIILTIHLILVSLLIGWRMSMIFIPTGLIISFTTYNFIIGELYVGEIENIKLKFLYILFFVLGLVVTILKAKQEYLEETEGKIDLLVTKVTELNHHVNDLGVIVETKEHAITSLNQQVEHYSERVNDQIIEIERLGATAQKILNNVNHELRLPVSNVTNFAEILYEGLEKYSQKQLKELTEEVYKNSIRLSSMILNMLDLATLNSKKVELQKKTINFSELVEERVKQCRKIYLKDKPIDFKLEIDPEILILIDPNYIRQVVDNIVINAINFSDKGLIEVKVKRIKNGAKLIIIDEGIGIPAEDIYNIFDPFKMGANAETKANGRGVGLALCKTAIEAHGGTINVQSNSSNTTFIIIL